MHWESAFGGSPVSTNIISEHIHDRPVKGIGVRDINNYVRRFSIDFSVFRSTFKYLMLSLINFGPYLIRRCSLDETHPSAHPGNAKVVIKQNEWAQ